MATSLQADEGDLVREVEGWPCQRPPSFPASIFPGESPHSNPFGCAGAWGESVAPGKFDAGRPEIGARGEVARRLAATGPLSLRAGRAPRDRGGASETAPRSP